MYIKVVQSGLVTEVYQYEKTPPYLIHPPQKKNPRRIVLHKRRLSNNVLRARKSLKGIIISNLSRVTPPTLITLTMFEHLSISASWQFVTCFFTRLRKEWGSSFRYIAVPEWQKSGRVHFHCLVWGAPDFIHAERNTRYLQHRWLRGFVDCSPTDGSPKIAHYLTKYLSKSMSDARLAGAKAYSCSRNCLRPVHSKGGAIASYLDEIIEGEPEYQREYQTQFLGRCNYSRWSRLDT